MKAKLSNPFYTEFILKVHKSGISHTTKFLAFKKQFCARHHIPEPTNANLRILYENLVKQKQIPKNPGLEKAMLAHAIRTQSGIAVVAVLTKPFKCPGNCIYCPTEKGMPKSYLSNEPAVMRAILNQFHPYKQTQNRLRSLEINGHATDKIELIIMGGTFSFFPKRYQKWFIKECFRACNTYDSKRKMQNTKCKTLEDALCLEQKRNERAKHRIVGLTLETRPDYIDENEIVNFRKLGCTRVELGVQSVFDDVLKKNKRGHFIAETIQATRLLKDAGFKINFHMMPGLLGSSVKKDYEMFKVLFNNSQFQPDMLKIYPTVVIKNAELYRLWKNGKYRPLSDKKFENLAVRLKNEIIPQYVRIARLVRDVPAPSIEAGPRISNLREAIGRKAHCQCIRCREVRKKYTKNEKVVLDRIDYDASDGKEIFLQYVSPDKQKLFALLRLRIPSKYGNNNKVLHSFPILEGAALIREIHTYGILTPITKKSASSPQHIGLGKKLLRKAEQIAKNEFKKKKMVVISGIGVRQYYRKQNYCLRDTYMFKLL